MAAPKLKYVTLKTEKQLKAFLDKAQHDKNLYNITYKHDNKTKVWRLGTNEPVITVDKKTGITNIYDRRLDTIAEARVYIDWNNSKDGGAFVKKVFNSVRSEYLITITFRTKLAEDATYKTKFISRVQNGDLPDKKMYTTQNAVRQYYEKIYGIYGTQYVYAIRVTKEKLKKIGRPKESTNKVIQTDIERMRKQLGKTKFYVLVDKYGKETIHKYKK